MLATTFDDTLANTSLSLYVESASGNQSFYIDDFKITFIPPAVAERDIPSVYQTLADQFPVGSAVRAADLTGESAVLLTKHFNSMTSENDMKWDATEPTRGRLHLRQRRRAGRVREGEQHARPRPHAGLARPDPGLGVQRRGRQPDDADAGEPGAADPAHAEPHPRRW